MTNQPRLYLLIPAALLVLALLPWPYGYFTFLRLVVTVSALIVAYLAFKERGSVYWLVIVAGLVACLFNPLVPVHLDRAIWSGIDLITAALFAYLSVRRDWAAG